MLSTFAQLVRSEVEDGWEEYKPYELTLQELDFYALHSNNWGLIEDSICSYVCYPSWVLYAIH
jgi:hypothetical protein